MAESQVGFVIAMHMLSSLTPSYLKLPQARTRFRCSQPASWRLKKQERVRVGALYRGVGRVERRFGANHNDRAGECRCTQEAKADSK